MYFALLRRRGNVSYLAFLRFSHMNACLLQSLGLSAVVCQNMNVWVESTSKVSVDVGYWTIRSRRCIETAAAVGFCAGRLCYMAVMTQCVGTRSWKESLCFLFLYKRGGGCEKQQREWLAWVFTFHKVAPDRNMCGDVNENWSCGSLLQHFKRPLW